MIRKILVFSHYAPNSNVGGPMGFYNQNIANSNGKYYETLDYYIEFPKWFNILSRIFGQKIMKQIIFWRILKRIRPPKNFPMNEMITNTISKYYFSEARKFSHIFVHDIYTYYSIKFLKPKFQKIIFQPHSPELFSEEVQYISDRKADKEFVLKIERDLFNNVNNYVFPNIGAVEIYSSLIKKHHEIHFLNSACTSKKVFSSQKMNKNKINLVFIGRRNKIKGFDIILETFRRVRQIRKDVELYLIGKGEIKVIEDGVNDIGHTQNPLSWISSCDIVINVNRQSYFDLVLMETLSVGTPIILFTNGGHKIFKEKYKSSGIYPLDNQIDLEKFLLSKNLSKKNNEQVKENIRIYNENFTPEIYQQNLDSLCKQIIFK
jgi:glycosyltransferase involved in cell wall biosynthesis